MAMKASLQLRVGTQLTMTPQLQQAIALLQLSTLDLRQEIQQALEANPMLELDDGFGEQTAEEAPEDDWASEIPSELSTDSDWSDTYPDHGASSGGGEGPDFERQAAGQSLASHLTWQLAMTDLSERQRQMRLRSSLPISDVAMPSRQFDAGRNDATDRYSLSRKRAQRNHLRPAAFRVGLFRHKA